jgi:hypothetical protein
MAEPNGNFIAATVQDVKNILNLIEQAQAIAAGRMQEWTALLANSFLDLQESDFEEYSFSLANFADIATALNAMPTLLAGWDVVFYRVKN